MLERGLIYDLIEQKHLYHADGELMAEELRYTFIKIVNVSGSFDNKPSNTLTGSEDNYSSSITNIYEEFLKRVHASLYKKY